MNNYTIYCKSEQTRKAFELGDFGRNNFKTRKEATLTAVDVALDYLEKIRKD